MQEETERDVEVWLRRKFESRIREIEIVMREDLDLVSYTPQAAETSCLTALLHPAWLSTCNMCATCVWASCVCSVERTPCQGCPGVFLVGCNIGAALPQPVSLQKNHLSGLKRQLLKVSFYNVQQLMDVRREVSPIIVANSKKSSMADAVVALTAGRGGQRPKVRTPMLH